MKREAWPEETRPDFDTVKTEDDFAEHFGKDTPTAEKVVNVTNVNPHLPTVDPNKMQISFVVFILLVCLSTLGVGELIALLVIR